MELHQLTAILQSLLTPREGLLDEVLDGRFVVSLSIGFVARRESVELKVSEVSLLI